MGAAPTNANPAQAGQAPASAEPTLAERLAADQDAAELDAQNQPVGAVEAPAAEVPPAPADALTARFDKLEKSLEDERADRKMERQMLLGALNQARAPQPVVVQQPPAPTPAPPAPTEDQLLESLKADPLGTIRRITADAVATATRETEERLTGRIRESGARTQAAVQHQDQMRQSALQYQQQFSDVLESPLGQEFDNECGREIISMYGQEWQNRITPDVPVSVASRVYTRWARAGKIPSNGGSANGQTTRPAGLREIIRSAPTAGASDRAAGSAGAPRGGPRTPSTIGELGLTATEERAARRVMSQWGLDERTWVNNWLAAKQDNPNYGNG